MLAILARQRAQQNKAAGGAASGAAGELSAVAIPTDPSNEPSPDIVTQAVRVVAALLSLPQALSRSRGSSTEGGGGAGAGAGAGVGVGAGVCWCAC